MSKVGSTPGGAELPRVRQAASPEADQVQSQPVPAAGSAERPVQASAPARDEILHGAAPGRHVETGGLVAERGAASAGQTTAPAFGVLGLLAQQGKAARGEAATATADIEIQPDIAARLRERFGDAANAIAREADGRLRLTAADGGERFAFVGDQGDVYEVSPYAFAVTQDLVAQMRAVHGDFLIKDVDRNGNGLITEDEIWDYFTFDVQQNRAAFDEINASLAEKHPRLMRFMADRDLQAEGRKSDRVEGEFQAGLGDMRELVQQKLQETAELLGKPVDQLSDIERFNTAVLTYRELGIEYDPVWGPDKSLQLARNRDQGGTFSAAEVFADSSTPALCLEQSYLMANLLREAGLVAQVNGVASPGGDVFKAWSTHATVSVELGGQRVDIEPQRATFFDTDYQLGAPGTDERRRRMQGGTLLTRLSDAHQRYQMVEPLNDKQALGAGFSNTAWSDFTRVIDDKELTPERRSELLARGRESIALARDMLPSFIEVPAVDVLGDLAAYSMSGSTDDLETAEAKLDRYLALPHWRPIERKFLLSIKREAMQLRGGDTSQVDREIWAIQSPYDFYYENAVL